jgi:hypothetical protein
VYRLKSLLKLAVDRRTCHDAKHHPTFQREAGWKLIEHGLEPAKQ